PNGCPCRPAFEGNRGSIRSHCSSVNWRNLDFARAIQPPSRASSVSYGRHALVEDRARMLALPPVAPATGLRTTERLARDYYVRIASVDYSVDPRVIGRLVEVVASLHTVTVTCAGTLVAEHRRSWSRRGTVTNPEHVELAKQLRVEYWQRTREQPP